MIMSGKPAAGRAGDVRVQDRLSRMGEFATEREAAQVRDQRALALGLSPLVRLNFPGEQERSPACWKTCRR
jgi:hypothetical protein